MALEIHKEDAGRMLRSDRRLYLTRDEQQVVEEGHPDANTLLVAAGGLISEKDAKQYGLELPSAAVTAPADDAVDTAKSDDAASKTKAKDDAKADETKPKK